jgi:hypothetical protein
MHPNGNAIRDSQTEQINSAARDLDFGGIIGMFCKADYIRLGNLPTSTIELSV